MKTDEVLEVTVLVTSPVVETVAVKPPTIAPVRGGHVGDGRRAGCALADHDGGLGDAVGAGVVRAGGTDRGDRARARAT